VTSGTIGTSTREEALTGGSSHAGTAQAKA
jgi:hypothetical protein